MYVKKRKSEQFEETRAQLLRVARSLFAERGYSAVSTEEIVQRSGVTRGALYYHFRDKQALFRAVAEQLEEETTGRIAAAARLESDPWRAQLLALEAYLDTCLEPAVQRILLMDAPSVLGLAEWREIESAHGLALVRQGLEAAIEAGLMEPQPVESLAHLLLGAFKSAGAMISRARDQRAARREAGESAVRLLEGLRVEREPSGRESEPRRSKVGRVRRLRSRSGGC